MELEDLSGWFSANFVSFYFHILKTDRNKILVPYPCVVGFTVILHIQRGTPVAPMTHGPSSSPNSFNCFRDVYIQNIYISFLFLFLF